MDPQLRLEKKILRISLVGSILFLVAEVIFAVLTGSMAILMDCVYDIADLIMIGPFLALVPLLYKPETEKRPYGFSQVESLFVLIKYMILLAVDAVLIIESLQLIFHGGNEVNASVIVYFELAVSAGCFTMYLILTRMNRKLSTPSLKAELFIWKLDAAATLAVGLAFVLGLLLSRTSLAFLVPYVDPGIAIILAVALLKEPLAMIFGSVRNLILFAPEKEIFDQIRAKAETAMSRYGAEITFMDIIRTGRKLWVHIYFKPAADEIHLSAMKAASEEINEALSEELENLSLELVPDIETAPELAERSAEPRAWRKEKIDYLSEREEKKQKKQIQRKTK